MEENKITFITGDESLLDDIWELWEELNRLHVVKSVNFTSFYQRRTFSTRKETLMHHAKNGKLFVAIVYYKETKVGYCISSIVDGIGEIDSIFIQSNYRRCNIGKMLMEMSLDWLKSNNVKRIILKVSVGNEEVFKFYSKFGFAPRLTELQML